MPANYALAVIGLKIALYLSRWFHLNWTCSLVHRIFGTRANELSKIPYFRGFGYALVGRTPP